MKVLFPISADPITNGHLSLIKRLSNRFDIVIVGIGTNINKKYILDENIRFTLVERVCKDLSNVEVMKITGLLVDFVRNNNIDLVIRGIRNGSDIEYEKQISNTNYLMYPEFETLFMFSNPNEVHVSSSIVKEIVKLNGDVSSLVPIFVKEMLEYKVNGIRRIGVTGLRGVGKTTVLSMIEKYFEDNNIKGKVINLDDIVDKILTLPSFWQDIPHQLQCLKNKNKKDIAIKIFSDDLLYQNWIKYLYPKVFNLIRRMELKKGPAIYVYEIPLLFEEKLCSFVNNNIIYVYTDEESKMGKYADRIADRRDKKRLSYHEVLNILDSIDTDNIYKIKNEKGIDDLCISVNKAILSILNYFKKII